MDRQRWAWLCALAAAAFFGPEQASAADVASSGHWPPWSLVALGCLLGVALSAVVAYGWLLLPLLDAARACNRVAAGDLSPTLREAGPLPLRSVARVFNTVLADFQEVLLLFAYFLRSARASIQVLRERSDGDPRGNAVRSLCAATLDDLDSMQEMIQGFHYFRVRIERGTITDTGVGTEGATNGAGSRHRPASVERLAAVARLADREGSDHE